MITREDVQRIAKETFSPSWSKYISLVMLERFSVRIAALAVVQRETDLLNESLRAGWLIDSANADEIHEALLTRKQPHEVRQFIDLKIGASCQR